MVECMLINMWGDAFLTYFALNLKYFYNTWLTHMVATLLSYSFWNRHAYTWCGNPIAIIGFYNGLHTHSTMDFSL